MLQRSIFLNCRFRHKIKDGNCGQLKFSNSHRSSNSKETVFSTKTYKLITQVLKYLHCGTQDYSELFPKLSKDNIVKIILHLIKVNSILEVQHAVGHQFTANSSQNKKFSDSTDIQSLKEKLESAINETLLTVPALKKGQSLENMAENEIRFF